MLRQHRVRAGLTQEALAERAGLGTNAVTALERGARRSPHPSTVKMLADALGLDELERSAFVAAVGRSGSRDEVDPVATDERVGPELPVWLTSFVGRETEVASARALLDPDRSPARLLTLLGPGGVGKTRLAVTIATELISAFADGVVFVDLVPVSDERLVPATIARALQLREGGGRSARELLLAHLHERQTLLLLDNFEHLLGAARQLTEFLEECPRLSLLVTSRAALRLRVERRLVVQPLATPGSGAEASSRDPSNWPAVRLFVDRARAVVPDFGLDGRAGAAVVEICQRLDGLPLAIELATARMALMPPEALLQRLARRLPMLTAGPHDLPERQQTLRRTLAWSYELLSPADQVLFRRLAVFVGGCTLEAAEAVAADGQLAAKDVLDRLQTLVESSLVRTTNDSDVVSRLTMLETVREFALEVLESSGEADLIRSRLSAFLVELAEALVAEYRSTGCADPIVRLIRGRDNLWAALDWLAGARQWQQALRLAAAAHPVWAADGQLTEGRERLDDLLAAAPEPTPARAAALLTSAALAWGQGDYRRQEKLARESLDIARASERPDITAEALSTLGAVAFQRGEYSQARVLLRQSLDLFRELEQRLGLGWALMRLASVARDEGAFQEAEQLYLEALEFRRDAGDQTGVAHILSNLSWLALYTGAYAPARDLQLESLAIRRAAGDRREIAVSLIVLGRIALDSSDHGAAWDPVREGLELSRQVGDRWAIALGLEVVAGLLAVERPAHALKLAGAADGVRAAIGRPLPPPERTLVDAWLEPAWRALGDAGLAEWSEGVGLSTEAALDQALAEDLPAASLALRQ
jgi:predicted ATPase/DNA-binding XRE family transcriptional regulator